MANLININKLNTVIRENSKTLVYINLNETGTAYDGWISNFHIYKKSDINHLNNLSLNLFNDNDLFLLFVLASCWSRTGQFENATYFTIYLKHFQKDDPSLWLNKEFVNYEKEHRFSSVYNIMKVYEDVSRNDSKDISFRSDFYDGVAILADKWEYLKAALDESQTKSDYSIFINRIRSIGGIGGSGIDGRMSIKIPLILRELRVANRFSNIPGEWCCVPDTRVLKACKSFEIDFKFPDNEGKYPLTNQYVIDPGIVSVLKKSQIIYSFFKDLYDIPLFAYEDLIKKKLI